MLDDRQKRLIRNAIKTHTKDLVDPLAVKAKNVRHVNNNAIDGIVTIRIDSTDCDGTRGVHFVNVAANYYSVQKVVDRNYYSDEREGPVFLSLMPPQVLTDEDCDG